MRISDWSSDVCSSDLVTKIIERGTKSIDVMLYFLLFNIAPTVIELVAVCVIFFLKFGWGMVGVTLLMVVLYIWYTRMVTEWRTQLRRDMVDLDTTAFAHAVDSLDRKSTRLNSSH